MKKSDEQRFHKIAHHVLHDSRYQVLKTFIQHGTVTTYDHCLRVAKTAFFMNLKWRIHADEEEVVLAGLLHDFYLYDWHTHDDHLHGYHHPAIASYCAKRDFHINERVQSAIETHMWPLTLFHYPRNRVGWLITIADKMCSLHETVLER